MLSPESIRAVTTVSLLDIRVERLARRIAWRIDSGCYGMTVRSGPIGLLPTTDNVEVYEGLEKALSQDYGEAVAIQVYKGLPEINLMGVERHFLRVVSIGDQAIRVPQRYQEECELVYPPQPYPEASF